MILMEYSRELAPGGCHGSCHGTDASPQGSEEAARFGCCAAHRGCTGAGVGAGARPINSFRKIDLYMIFKNPTVPHTAIEIRRIADIATLVSPRGLKRSDGVGGVRGGVGRR